jgi:hypothetical protein
VSRDGVAFCKEALVHRPHGLPSGWNLVPVPWLYGTNIAVVLQNFRHCQSLHGRLLLQHPGAMGLFMHPPAHVLSAASIAPSGRSVLHKGRCNRHATVSTEFVRLYNPTEMRRVQFPVLAYSVARAGASVLVTPSTEHSTITSRYTASALTSGNNHIKLAIN